MYATVDSGSITKIIGKFLQGNCSDEEFAYLLYWYETFDERPAIALNDKEKTLLRAKILNRIQQNIPELQQDNHVPMFYHANKTKRISLWWKYVAAAVVIGIMAWGGFRYYNNKSSARQGNRQTSTSSDLITLNNKSKRMHFILLPDSSKVWLSPDSKIAYSDEFMGPDRLVSLNGEAFFEIHSDPSHPFIVTSGILVTRVLGTSFLLKAYEGAPMEVAVMTGKVEVSRKGGQDRQITLCSKQKAVLDPGGELVKETTMEKDIVNRWQKVNLSFNNASLKEVMQALDQKFDIHIHCQEKKIGQYRLNADFTHQNLTNILEMLEKSLNIHYEMENDSTINFYTNNSSL
jgi:ferric-dicitrate binding protein FerR (iron transport regulator)